MSITKIVSNGRNTNTPNDIPNLSTLSNFDTLLIKFFILFILNCLLLLFGGTNI